MWSTTPTLDSLTLTAQSGAGAALWGQHNPTIDGTVGTDPGDVGGCTLGQSYQPVRWTNAPSGPYIDDTWHLGPNVGTLSGGVGRFDTSRPNFALSFESQFWNGQCFGQEFHLQGVSTDGLTTFRPWSVFMAHDGSVMGAALKVSSFVIAGLSDASLMQFHEGNAAIDVGANDHPITLRFVENNQPALQQLNAAGSGYVNLLYLDNHDTATIAAPLDVVAPRTSASFATFQPTTANSNDTGVKVAAPTMPAGNFYGFRASGGIAGAMRSELENTGAGPAQFRAVVSGATGGDPSILFSVPGAQDYSLGVRNADDDALILAAASSLGSNVRLRIARDGTMMIPVLAGVGRRSLCVESDGTLVAV